MFQVAVNGNINNTDYIRFGTGPRNLVILPGLGDGLKTVRGTALPMAWMYRIFAKDFTVFMFSRSSSLPQGHSTRDMAQDLKETMDALGIEKGDILGVSMGGMIAQWLAIDHPDKVEKLILAVTSPRPNDILTESLMEWMAQAKANAHGALMESNLRKIYSEGYYRKSKPLLPLLSKITRPKSYDRFLIQAEACLHHNAFDLLPRICSPTLVIGGQQDKALGWEASREMAAQIPGAELKLYPQWGHGLYEEAPDFNRTVLEFLKK